LEVFFVINSKLLIIFAENIFFDMTSALNSTQLHLLEMFSYARTPEAFDEIKKALFSYFADKVESDMDALWDSGEWDNEKNESILNEHLRTEYK